MKLQDNIMGILVFGLVAFLNNQEPKVHLLTDPILILGDETENTYIGKINDYVLGNSDTIYVLDGNEKGVIAFNMNGQFLFRFGREGQGPGEFVEPFAITFSGNKIYVTDLTLFRVSEFNANGDFLRTFSVESAPMSIVVNNEVAYVGTRSFSTLVLQIPLNDPYNQVSVLDYDHPALNSVDLKYRGAHPLLAIVEGNLVVCLTNTGQLAIGDLDNRNLEFNISEPQTLLVNEYFKEFEELAKIEEGDNIPGYSVPSVYITVSPWSGGCILLEIRRGRAQTFDPIGIVINYSTLDEVGIRFISQGGTYTGIKSLGDNRIGMINFETATVNVFKY